MQTKFGTEGNCYSACIASLLDMSLDEVPYFAEGAGQHDSGIFWERVFSFLEMNGYDIRFFDYDKHSISLEPDQFYIVAGKSPRGYMHGVIYKGNQLYHDPHPDNTGVIPQTIDYIFKTGN
jgi:hypothetical protein